MVETMKFDYFLNFLIAMKIQWSDDHARFTNEREKKMLHLIAKKLLEKIASPSSSSVEVMWESHKKATIGLF